MRRKLLNFKRSSAAENDSVIEYGMPVDVTDDGSPAPTPGTADTVEQVVASGSVFDSVLSQELLAPSIATADPPPAPSPVATPPVAAPVAAAIPAPMPNPSPLPASDPVSNLVEPPTSGVEHLIVESSIERDLLRAEMADGVDVSDGPVAQSPSNVGTGELSVDQLFDASHAPAPASASAFLELSFWDRYDEATASAELFAVPPAAITAIVGALHVAAPVAERCRASHWVTECDVYVLTSRPELVEDPSWKILKRPSDVVALLDDGLSDFPLIVVDIPRELPTWIRPLASRLRAGGVGLVRYVLDDDPSDEDLATWHGELGRPSVLDLVAAVPPNRVLELLDRGEPVASVGGMPITADLLMALRLSV